MTKQNRSTQDKRHTKKDSKSKPTITQPIGNPPGVLEVLGGLTDGSTIQTQAAQLGDPRLQSAQRQMMAARIGRTQGNRHLGRVMNELAPPGRSGPIQRDWLSDAANFVGDALNLRENEAALDLWEDYQDAVKELKKFKAKPHKAPNFQSTTKLGMFDAEYKPAKNTLEITCKCQFNFINATATKYPKAKPDELTWTDKKEEEQWKNKFLSIVSAAWTIEHPIFYCQKDWWESLIAKVVTKFVAVDADPHFVLNITKVPKKAKSPRSKVKRPKVKDDGSYTPGIGTFDEKDLKLTKKKGGKHIPAVHEAGHMLGLDDEYITGKKKVDERDPKHAHLVKSEFGHGVARGADGRIMSGGSDIQPEHTVTFLAALREATGMDEWTATKCPVPKPIPPNPHMQGAGDYPLPSSDTRPA